MTARSDGRAYHSLQPPIATRHLRRLSAVLVMALTILMSQAAAQPTLRTLYNFTNGRVGCNPYAGLRGDPNGALYGLSGYCGDGTVFELAPQASPDETWTVTVLHTFSGKDGDGPTAGLAMDRNGALFGTTSLGGTGTPNQLGTVFELIPPASPGGAWTETVLHSFSGSDGGTPCAGVVIGKDGVLYGMTYYGGTSYDGTVFKLSPPGVCGWRLDGNRASQLHRWQRRKESPRRSDNWPERSAIRHDDERRGVDGLLRLRLRHGVRVGATGLSGWRVEESRPPQLYGRQRRRESRCKSDYRHKRRALRHSAERWRFNSLRWLRLRYCVQVGATTLSRWNLGGNRALQLHERERRRSNSHRRSGPEPGWSPLWHDYPEWRDSRLPRLRLWHRVHVDAAALSRWGVDRDSASQV